MPQLYLYFASNDLQLSDDSFNAYVLSLCLVLLKGQSPLRDIIFSLTLPKIERKNIMVKGFPVFFIVHLIFTQKFYNCNQGFSCQLRFEQRKLYFTQIHNAYTYYLVYNHFIIILRQKHKRRKPSLQDMRYEELSCY